MDEPGLGRVVGNTPSTKTTKIEKIIT